MAGRKPVRRSRFKPHFYDIKFEWQLQALLKKHERHQSMVMHHLLADCWEAGLQESDILETIERFEEMSGAYSLSYLRGMLLADKHRAEKKQEAAIW